MSKIFFFCLGILLLVIGVAGLILPGLPGTFPLILSAGCFARSNTRIERWMLNHPHIGPPINGWRDEGSISRKHKIIAVTMLWISISLVCMTATAASGAIAVICAIGVTIYLLTRPTRVVIAPSEFSEENPIDAC